MRRVLVLGASVIALTIAAVSPVAAAKPDHSRPGVGAPLVFAAGEMCDFALTVSTSEVRSKTTTWEADDGTVRILDRGFASGVATNTDDEVSLHQQGGYHIDVVIHPDGSVDVKASGVLVAFYFPGDPVEGLSSGAWAVRGHGTEHYAADGSLTSATFQGQIIADLCHSLAPAA